MLPVAFAFLLPLVTFIVIGRTVEVKKAADEAGETIVTAAATAAAAAQALREAASAGVPGAAEGLRDHLRRGLGGLSPKTAVSGLTTLTMFFTPHLQTLPIHSSLKRAKRQQFAVPILASGLLILVLSLPFALVPYYLLPAGPTAFDQLPRDDAWTNFARVLMCFLVLASVSSWLVRGRDSILVALGADGGDRYRAGKFVGAGIWVVVVAFAALGGVVANKIELLGVIATLAIGWFLPCKSPLARHLPQWTQLQIAKPSAELGGVEHSQANISPLLHHHVPRPLPARDHLPQPRPAAAYAGAGTEPVTGDAPAHTVANQPGCRRAARPQGAATTEAEAGKAVVAGSHRVCGHLACRHRDAVLERGKLDRAVVSSWRGRRLRLLRRLLWSRPQQPQVRRQ